MKARLLAAVVTASPVLALAHQAGLSYGSFTLEKDRVEIVLRLPAAELSAAFSGAAAPGSLRDGVPEDLARALLATITVAQDAGPCVSTPGAGQLEAPDGVRLPATFRCPREDEPVEVRLGFVSRMLPGHVHVARALVGGSVQELVVDARHEALRVEARRSWARAARFVRVGIEHIFSGWDHVAFLLGLLLAGGRLRDVIRVVTSFTVGHASTLALATLGVVTPPATLIEPLIAASVVYVGLENLLELRRRSARPGRRWPIALAFGFVHGFGFAGALGPLGLERTGLVTALFSFNLGVELGQAAIVALAFPLLTLLRRRPAFDAAGPPVGSAMVGCAGLVWLVGRIPW